MLEHRLLRREPRVLAIRTTRSAINFAAADAWEVRGIGSVSCESRRATSIAIARIILQTRPSVVIVVEGSDVVAKTIACVARRRGLSVVHLAQKEVASLAHQAPSTKELRVAYPETTLLLAGTESGGLHDLLALAVAALAHLDLPPRRYAPSRKPVCSASRMVRRRARGHRQTCIPHRKPDRLVRGRAS